MSWDSVTYVEIEVDEIIKETELAVLCVIDGEEVWLPRSQIDGGDDLDEGFSGTIQLADWLARERGL